MAAPNPVHEGNLAQVTMSGRQYADDVAGTGVGLDRKHDPDEKFDELSDSSSEISGGPLGVKQVEAVARTWSPLSLGFAYAGLFLLNNMTALEGQTTYLLTPYATSAFSQHALLATVLTVQGILLAVIKPPMAMIANVFGRLTAFSISVFLYVLGYIMKAGANNVRTYAAASIFYSSGSTGLQILIQIFISDTTDLRWRVFVQAVIQYIPFVWTYWAGPSISGKLATDGQWRWGYGMWAIVLPVAFSPLFVALAINSRKARKLGYMPKSPYSGQAPLEIAKRLWFDLDLFGLLLLTAGLCLLLLPLSLANEAKSGWRNPSMIAMIVIGGVILIVFPFWERSRKLAPKAFFPRDLFKNWNVIVGCLIAFFYYWAFYMSVLPYFSSYLLVVEGLDATTAARVSQVFNFASSITAVIVGLLVYLTQHLKYWVVLGSAVYITGIGLMIKYRDENTTVGSLLGTQICVGIGGGMLNQPALLSVQAAASHGQLAAATAAFLTILEVGGAVGNAVSGAVWTATIPAKLEAYLPADAKSQAASIFASITTAYTQYPKGTPERAAIDRAYNETMRTLLIVAVCLSAPLLPLSLLMKSYKLGDIDQKVSGLVIGGKKETTGASERQLEGRRASVQGETTTPSRLPKIFRR